MTGAYLWTDGRVRAALGLPSAGEAGDHPYTRVSTDSRAVEPGALFVALAGERFDGHDYVGDALSKGARGAVVSRPVSDVAPEALYEVADTLVALGRLASHRRSQLDAPVVGITGSSGKTGTKELTRAALAGSFRVHATPGNRNNRVGLPLTLLDAPDQTDVVVLEMGTNEPGEIEALTAIAGPQIGVITTVSETHLEKLGSLGGVLDEKLELLHGLADGSGTAAGAVVGDEPPELPKAATERRPGCRVAGWSERADADLMPNRPEMAAGGRWGFRWKGHPVSLQSPGKHAVRNALLALAVAEMLDVPPEEAARGVSAVAPDGMRGETRLLGDLALILDCYNANPQSTRAAADLLCDLTAGGRVLFLGTMLELGERSADLHAEVLRYVCAGPIERVVATGAFATAARTAVDIAGREGLLVGDDPEAAYQALRGELAGDETVLLKASRGVRLERLIPLLEADFGAARVPAEEGRA